MGHVGPDHMPKERFTGRTRDRLGELKLFRLVGSPDEAVVYALAIYPVRAHR